MLCLQNNLLLLRSVFKSFINSVLNKNHERNQKGIIEFEGVVQKLCKYIDTYISTIHFWMYKIKASHTHIILQLNMEYSIEIRNTKFPITIPYSATRKWNVKKKNILRIHERPEPLRTTIIYSNMLLFGTKYFYKLCLFCIQYSIYMDSVYL